MSWILNQPIAEAQRRLVIFGLFIIGLIGGLLVLRFSFVDNADIVADLHVYFASSKWVVAPGRLYVDYPSEYPLLANLWFSIPRLVNSVFAESLRGFAMAYVVLATGIYGGFFYHAGSHPPHDGGRTEIFSLLIAAMSPALVQLVLLRYDFLPAIFVFYGLYSLREKRVYLSAVLFGVAIALKGYPIVYAPALLIYIHRISPLRRTAGAACLIALPAVLATGLTWAFAGYDGMMSPFLFHARRSFDELSVYQLFFFYIDHETLNAAMSFSVRGGSALLALTGALYVRPNFTHLARILAFQTFGLLILSPITSPQFMIWALPILFFVVHPKLSVLFAGFVLLSNFWIVREFGLPELANFIFWLAQLAFKFSLWILSGIILIHRPWNETHRWV